MNLPFIPTDRLLTLAALVTCIVTSTAPGQAKHALDAPPVQGEIASLIRDLSDPTYARRTYATRRLCAIGMPAHDALTAAATDDNTETALRAGAVLTVLDGLLFSGVDVRLVCAKSQIRWDESVDLDVVMVNRSAYPARVPFAVGSGRTLTKDARQVGNLLDIADVLRVRRVDGSVIDPVVDDIALDESVEAAVQERLNGGPRTTLEPGAQTTLTVDAFNRGWARYPLLDPGEYRVRLEYVPQWRDDVLAAERIGRVVSDELSIVVTKGAPETVSRHGHEASIDVRREGDFLIASLTNRSDQPRLINRDFGVSPPFARGEWVYEHDGDQQIVSVAPDRQASMESLDESLVSEVAPGATIELARVPIDQLQVKPPGAERRLIDARATIHFAYTNLCDRRWQARQGDMLRDNPKAPPLLRKPLPRRLLSGRFMSDRRPIPADD